MICIFSGYTCNLYTYITIFSPILNEIYIVINQNIRIVEENKETGKNEIYSQRVRAGKRTYFFDVKATRSNDYYLTITESKRRYKEDGYFYEKHKIFLYKEDFDKFIEALQTTIEHVKTELLPEYDFSQVNVSENEGKPDEADSELKWE